MTVIVGVPTARRCCSVPSATIYSTVSYYSNIIMHTRWDAGIRWVSTYFDAFDTRHGKSMAGVQCERERRQEHPHAGEYATNAGQNKYSNASRSFAVCTFMLLSYPFSIKKCNMRCARPRQQDQQQQRQQQHTALAATTAKKKIKFPKNKKNKKIL